MRRWMMAALLNTMVVAGDEATAADTCQLVVEGIPKAVIVVDAGHIKTGRKGYRGTTLFAAEQLRSYLARMTGAELPIEGIADGEENRIAQLMTRPTVVVGDSALARRLGVNAAEMQPDEFLLRVTPERVIVAGRDSADAWTPSAVVPVVSGTLHGVYTLLRQLGVRDFFQDDALAVVPEIKSVAVPVGERQEAPFFPYRCGYGDGRRIQQRYWGYVAGYGGGPPADPWVTRHSFANPWLKLQVDGKETSMVWWDRYREDHPDWFWRDENGQFIGRHGFIDFTREDVRQQAVRDAQAWFDMGNDYFTLLQNDGAWRMDARPSSQALIDPSRGTYGYLSELIMKPLIQIARELEKSHPDKHVTLGAYHGYTRPPAGVTKLPRNAVVMIALRRMNNILPEAKAENHALLEEWLRLDPVAIYVWEYYVYPAAHWVMKDYDRFPRFTPHVIAEDIAHLSEVRKRNPALQGQWLFAQTGDPHEANAWWLLPNAYFTGRLLWDPTLDIDVLLDDFYRHAFGDAAGHMREFYSRCESVWTGAVARMCAEKRAAHELPSDEILTADAMGNSFIDRYPSREDYLGVWNRQVRDELSAILDRAAIAAKGRPEEARVTFVRDGFAFTEALD